MPEDDEMAMHSPLDSGNLDPLPPFPTIFPQLLGKNETALEKTFAAYGKQWKVLHDINVYYFVFV